MPAFYDRNVYVGMLGDELISWKNLEGYGYCSPKVYAFLQFCKLVSLGGIN